MLTYDILSYDFGKKADRGAKCYRGASTSEQTSANLGTLD